MRDLINLERRGSKWVVFMRSGRVEYASTCYAKAVGVFDYLALKREAIKAKDDAELQQIRNQDKSP